MSDRTSGSQHGFTLTELSIVLAIIGIVLGATLKPLNAGLEYSRREETRLMLTQVVEAAVGFASVHGYLPCPAQASSQGWAEDTCPGDTASGFVPAASLGLPGQRDEQGRLLDSWQQPVRYVVSASDHATRGHPGQPDFSTSGEMALVGMSFLQSELTVCRRAGAVCSRKNIVANQIPLLVFSLAGDQSASPEQQENQDGDAMYVVRDYSRQPGSEFDDLIHWIPENQLFYRLIAAAELP